MVVPMDSDWGSGMDSDWARDLDSVRDLDWETKRERVTEMIEIPVVKDADVTVTERTS